jgi:aspartate 1-decarboxylase
MGSPGDRLIVMAFAQVDQEDAPAHCPKVVRLDEGNNIIAKAY